MIIIIISWSAQLATGRKFKPLFKPLQSILTYPGTLPTRSIKIITIIIMIRIVSLLHLEWSGNSSNEDSLPWIEGQGGVQHKVCVAQLPRSYLHLEYTTWQSAFVWYFWSFDSVLIFFLLTGLSLMVGELTQRYSLSSSCREIVLSAVTHCIVSFWFSLFPFSLCLCLFHYHYQQLLSMFSWLPVCTVLSKPGPSFHPETFSTWGNFLTRWMKLMRQSSIKTARLQFWRFTAL